MLLIAVRTLIMYALVLLAIRIMGKSELSKMSPFQMVITFMIAELAATPMGRFGKASDLLGCVNWLLDDEASGFVTGITVPVDGGFLTLGGV